MVGVGWTLPWLHDEEGFVGGVGWKEDAAEARKDPEVKEAPRRSLTR